MDRAIELALATLPSEAQEILQMRFERGLDIDQIAKRVHQPRVVVRQRLRLALSSAARAVKRQMPA